jgi:hypothetical protein
MRISFLDGIEPDLAILDLDDLAKFDDGAKIRFLYSKIVKRRQPEVAKLEQLLGQLELALNRQTEIDEANKLSILEEATIVGMTVSGAAINRRLLVSMI